MLERLFTRFNERVPFETASKILRDAHVPDLAEKPRRPDIFWKEHLELGTGGTCFARVAAFEDLLARLGFSVRRVLGAVESDFDHAALMVDLAGEEWICDVGFPLPVLLRPVEGEVETVLGDLRLSAGDRGVRIEFSEGVPEGPRAVEIFNAPVSAEEFWQRWGDTFRPGSHFLSGVFLRKLLENRAISFSRGELRVDDRHSRARIPLPGPRAARLEELFGVDSGVIARALARAGDREPEIASAEIGVYLETATAPADAFAAIASPEGYARLMGAVAQVSVEPEEGSWRARLGPLGAPASATPLEEEVVPDRELLSLRVRRASRESFYLAESHRGRSFLVRRGILPGSGEDLLRNDSLRGRLAGSLAVDLLAWARMLK